MRNVSNPFGNLQYDLPASIVVFLVALPLCLGIALASGAPILAGIIAGIIGGIVIGSLSGSNLSVSGPAAGLISIVIAAIHDLGSYQAFLLAVMFGGILQFFLGVFRAGTIGAFFPSSVIRGMLAAIGLILILKQIPHALGYDKDYEGDETFIQQDGQNTFSEIINAASKVTPGAIIISLTAIIILILWDKPAIKKNKVLKFIPGPLIAVIVGIVLNTLFNQFSDGLALAQEHLVSLQSVRNFSEFVGLFTLPDFSQVSNPLIYKVAVTLALVASLESLLSIEAADKLDQFKRSTPLNRELRSQGIGNTISGLLGGLPITAVIVRSSANINAGARTKLSTIVHGTLLLSTVILIPTVLNMIPLSALAAILLMTGYKLTSPSIYRDFFRKGWDQFLPFIITVLAILFTDLLVGIAVGMVVGLFFVVRSNIRGSHHHENGVDGNGNGRFSIFKKIKSAITIMKQGEKYLIKLNKDVSFLNRSVLRQTFERIPEGSTLVIDSEHAEYIDNDIRNTIDDFIQDAPSRNIAVTMKKEHGQLVKEHQTH
ncbi:SulP family inorganic anion transporter [Pseudochryseolinea flava]|uniref:SulP family inorganic anion transporter n=1 Tax=Pseudochryseolinea flava TaxID=2059302 RepID=A0A364XU39_9BACT|nr:SulP family inorganic anion transporter [Pseudochryseolinea flava]RAV97852.1 SulP family inorganic anion transporter [Pseudochryseolinea flava]